MSFRSLFRGGGRHSRIHPDEGRQAISRDPEHAATQPAAARAPGGRRRPLRAGVNDAPSVRHPSHLHMLIQRIIHGSFATFYRPCSYIDIYGCGV